MPDAVNGVVRPEGEVEAGTSPATGRVPSEADAVVVGGGTVGGWCAYFLKRAGLERVVVVEKGVVGSGASHRAAGMVRAQGGTPLAVRLGLWSERFYRGQAAEIGVDSGFVEQGYFIPAFTNAEVEAAKSRIAMQQSHGLQEVIFLERSKAEQLNPTFARGACLGGSYAPGDGYLDPPRNVLAYAVALQRVGVDVIERCSFEGLVLGSGGGSGSGGGGGGGGNVAAVETSLGPIETKLVVLTGGPQLRAVAAKCDVVVHAGGARHQVAVTEPHPDLARHRLGPMVFDLSEGIYWRPEDGGLLFGMSNPLEPPGEAREVDWAYLEKMRARLGDLVPVTKSLALRKVWAATIEYTPDHLPIIGPAFTGGDPSRAKERTVGGLTVACAAGHGMMWGPAVARLAAAVAMGDKAAIADVADPEDVASIGLDRFDESGRSRLAVDPIALPYPESAT